MQKTFNEGTIKTYIIYPAGESNPKLNLAQWHLPLTFVGPIIRYNYVLAIGNNMLSASMSVGAGRGRAPSNIKVQSQNPNQGQKPNISPVSPVVQLISQSIRYNNDIYK